MNHKDLINYFLGLWALGIGARFIIAYFLGDWYPYNSTYGIISNATFDLFFDWIILFTLGLLRCIFTLLEYFEHKGWFVYGKNC